MNVNAKIALIVAAVGGVFVSAVWVHTQTARDLVFEYQTSLSIEGRILDAAVFRDSIYVLTGDSGGTKLHSFNRNSGLRTADWDAKRSFAVAPDPMTGLIYLLATTSQRGPFHYIYALDQSADEMTLVSTLDEQYAYRDFFPGFVATGAGELVINNRLTAERPELVVVDQTTGEIDRYIDLPPALSDPSEPRLVRGEYLYKLRRVSTRVISALGINTGNLYVINVTDGSILHQESLGVPDFPPTVDKETGQLDVAPVVFDVYHMDGYRLDILNGFPNATGSRVINTDGSTGRLRVEGPQLAIGEVSYNSIERLGPTEWLAVDSIHLQRVDRLAIR